jgi:DNA-binding NarL/FixJ family response regulator
MNARQGGEVILVVDDSPETLSLINDTLEEAGYNVLVALEGRQALTIARRIRPDMILLDALMPQMDGFETCRELKRIPSLSSIPVIFMTGLSDTRDIVQGLSAGGVDYLTKPINTEELVARMQVHLNNARLTSHAWQALDTAGQHLFSTDATGAMAWATPQTFALFAKAGASATWQESSLVAQLQPWLARAPGNAPLSLTGLDLPLSIHHVQELPEGGHLLRLQEGLNAAPDALLREHLNLTARESEVLLWISNGKTNREIAEILDMSPRTVNKHLEQIFRKLGVENRTAAARMALNVLKG